MGSIAVSSAGLLIALLLVPLLGGDFLGWQIGLFLIFGLAAQGVGFSWGRGGFLPLGNALFFGIGAYGGGAALKLMNGAFLPSFLAFLAVALMASLLAYTLAILLFRGRSGSGPGFSLVTLALVLIAAQLAESRSDITGGFNGMGGIPPLGGLSPFGSHYYLIVGAVLTFSILLMMVDRLPAGLVLRGLVSQENRLELLGFAPHLIKASVFAFSAFMTAIAGSLFASHQGIVTPQAIGFAFSTELVIWAAVGGRFHPLGPLFGAVIIAWLSASIRDVFPSYEVIVAAVFLLVVLLVPGGAFQLVARIFKGKFGPKATSSLPSIDAPPSKASAQSGPLTLREVHLSAGEIKILNGLSLSVPEAGILCVIGPNGAGKTTMLNAVTGKMPVTSGEIALGKRSLRGLLSYRMLWSGIGRKLQIPTVFGDLTVRENLGLAMLAGRVRLADYFLPSALRWSGPALQQLLADPEVTLGNNMDKMGGQLPQGHRQVLELAMTIAAEPSILLLDEPAAGLSPAETALMVRLIREYQSLSSASVVIIEHDMALVEALSNEVAVLHQGQMIAQGDWHDIRKNPDVAAVYAGEHK